MAFDPIRYRESYLEPKARLKLSTLPDDLLERYAITLPASDAEIAATIKAVRATWSNQLAGSRAAKFAKLCIGADEQLKAQHRDEMLKASWWTAQAKRTEEASRGAIEQLTALLKETHGSLGVLTQSYLDGCAITLGLSKEQAEIAARESGLRVLTGEELPKAPPMEPSQFRTLQTNLATAGISSVVQLLHPTATKFSVLGRFAAEGVPNARLDGEAVGNQAVEASRQAMTTGNDARRRALDILKTFSARGDLHALALYDLAETARRSASLGSIGVRQQLAKIGVSEQDAAAIAVLIDDQASSGPTLGPERVEALLAEGRLIDATQAVAELSDSFDVKPQLLARVREARARYDALAAEALQLVKSADEVAALRKVRDASAISATEAEELLAAVPLPPVLNLIAGSEGVSAHLHWQPNVGYPDDVKFVVRRAEGAAPSTVLDGTEVLTKSSSEAVDEHPPVARTFYYSVFATTPRRPTSRPATVSMMLVPEPAELRAEVGTDSVSVHWTGHPSTARFIATRRSGERAGQELPVSNNTVELTGLPEGEPVTIEVTAEFRTPDGRVVRSSPANITATPRSQARPIESLRARASSSGKDSNVAISWRQIDSSEVRIRRSESPAPWAYGAWIEAEEFTRFGQEITGRFERSRGETTLHARLPEGRVHHLTPFSVGGTGIVVGNATTVGVTESVHNLQATQFTDFVKLTWLWPDGAGIAEVSWERSSDDPNAVGMEKVKKSEYERDGGFNVPIAPGRTEVQVRALMQVQGATFGSAPTHLTIDIATTQAKIEYELNRGPRLGPWGGRALTPTFRSASSVQSAKVVIIASNGPVLPISPDSGVLLAEIELSLTSNKVFTASTISIPKSVSRPFWVRCFALDEGVELVDPPLSKLKEA